MKKEFVPAVKFPLFFVFVLTCIHLYATLYDVKLSHWGVYPRETDGIYGIFSSVLIHGSWEHLFNNALPLLVLGTALFHFYKNLAPRVWLYSIIYTGILLWLGGRPSFHIGASGLVYALASFLFFSGFIRKHRNLMALSMCVVFLYGGMVWGIFPSQEHISWEAHLFGAINGLFWALYYKDEGPQRKKYSWELEEEMLKSLDGIEIIYEEVLKNDSEEESV
ncbi:MAG: rhomboid family intramembrane serine protease [Flavobacteriales bacterium]|nr:rhomboid family intramembrane serine protease [Flavobacteriales bacterium]